MKKDKKKEEWTKEKIMEMLKRDRIANGNYIKKNDSDKS
jgi:hypothetical protein